MSRLAKKPVVLPQGVSVTKDGQALICTGPKGSLRVSLPEFVEATISGQEVTMSLKHTETKKPGMYLGTAWALLRNAAHGVASGFSKVLEIEGVGYRAAMEGDTLVLHLGFVNPVRFKVPIGISISVEKNTVKVNGIDKELVGRVAAEIRAFKKPEPYKGKGIRYAGEVIRRKVGKKAAAATAS